MLIVVPEVLANPILLIHVGAVCTREILKAEREVLRAHVRWDKDDIH
jgi:hypothetical protein